MKGAYKGLMAITLRSLQTKGPFLGRIIESCDKNPDISIFPLGTLGSNGSPFERYSRPRGFPRRIAVVSRPPH